MIYRECNLLDEIPVHIEVITTITEISYSTSSDSVMDTSPTCFHPTNKLVIMFN